MIINLQFRIDPDAVDISGSSALHYAAGVNNLPLCRFLVEEHKADVHRFDFYKNTPLLSYLKAGHNGESHTVGPYLVSKGADINLTRLGTKDTTLHRAVKSKNAQLVRMFNVDQSLTATIFIHIAVLSIVD